MADNDEPTETPEQGAETGSAAGSGDASAPPEPAGAGDQEEAAEGAQGVARTAEGAEGGQTGAEASGAAREEAGPGEETTEGGDSAGAAAASPTDGGDEPAGTGEGGGTAESGEAPQAGETAETGGQAAEAGQEEAAEPRPAPRRTPSGDRPLCVGRRKTAVARARIDVGSGEYALNGRPLEEYFPTEKLRAVVTRPFSVIEQEGRWDVSARLHGGGLTGQAGALQLALARALAEEDPEWRGPLKHAGMLRRDARKVERKKYGRKKARKSPQYSKR